MFLLIAVLAVESIAQSQRQPGNEGVSPNQTDEPLIPHIEDAGTGGGSSNGKGSILETISSVVLQAFCLLTIILIIYKQIRDCKIAKQPVKPSRRAPSVQYRAPSDIYDQAMFLPVQQPYGYPQVFAYPPPMMTAQPASYYFYPAMQ